MNETIARKLWQPYDAQRERKQAVEEVLTDLERAVEANPALLRTRELLAHWRSSLEHAFPEKPLDVSIAVIGVFRGGKSTLINALLGASLLPAAHAATTATITKIGYRPSGYVVRVQYTGPHDEAFRAAREELLSLLGRPLEDMSRDLRDPTTRGAVEALLGMYGVLGEHGALLEPRVAELHAETQRARALPPLPHQELLGTVVEHRHDDLAAIEEAVKPYVMFTGAMGEFDLDAATRQFMISSVTIEGPFEVLTSGEGQAGSLSLIDTPGLEDPRPFVKRMVHAYLRAADCVCLNLSNHGNISAADVDVLRLLLTETLQRKLIVTLGKVDTLGADEGELRAHIEKQRSMLQARATELHQGDSVEAKRFIDETPILPVVALAALQRAQQRRGVVLDKHARRRLEDYQTAVEDGTQALFEQIRKTLDASSRLGGIVRRAEESLTRVVTNASSALSAGIEDRRLSAAQLEQKLADLERATEESNRALNAMLETKLSDARAQWKKRREDDRERFDAKLAELALRQMRVARGFVADATAAEWRHWRRLRAVAERGDFDGGQDSQLRDAIAQHALGGVPILLRSAIGAVLATCAESVGSAADISAEASKALSSAAGTMDPTQMAEIQLALYEIAAAEVRSASSEYRSHIGELARTVFEKNAVDKMSVAAEGIVSTWIEAVEGDAGRGVQARMHAALDDVMTRYVTELPDHVREMFGAEIDDLFRAAEEGAVGVYERVAKTASSFLSERLDQLADVARRAQTTAADAMDHERAVLVALRDRLASAAAAAGKSS